MWTIAALAVWTVTRLLRTFFDTLLRRPKRWFALYVFAVGAGVGAGALLMYLLAETWSPVAFSPERPSTGVLFLAAFVGAILSLAAGVVISATEQPPAEEQESIPLAARRLPVR